MKYNIECITVDIGCHVSAVTHRTWITSIFKTERRGYIRALVRQKIQRDYPHILVR